MGWELRDYDNMQVSSDTTDYTVKQVTAAKRKTNAHLSNITAVDLRSGDMLQTTAN